MSSTRSGGSTNFEKYRSYHAAASTLLASLSLSLGSSMKYLSFISDRCIVDCAVLQQRYPPLHPIPDHG
jgi:hypothetical protein